MDLGCGGGFPGIPLAVFYPECKFHLIDRIGKKIRVAQSIAERIGLSTVTFQHGDSGECHERFSYIVSRAVMPLPDLIKACRNNFMTLKDAPVNTLPPGLVCLKGGDLATEIASVSKKVILENIASYFSEPFFETKQIVYVPL